MRGIAIAQSVNKPNRHDANGVFVPGAKMFTAFHGLNEAPVWLDDVDDRNKMINAIDKCSNLETIAYFGHGDANRLGSAEIGMRDIPALAKAIRKAASPGCKVILYACFAGKPGGFAQALAAELGGRATIFGHSCKGHGNTNPFVTRYPYSHEDTQPFLIEPEDTELFAKWYKLIKLPTSDVWMRFPFLSKLTLETEVHTGIRMSLSVPWATRVAAEKEWKEIKKDLKRGYAKAKRDAQREAKLHPVAP